MKLPREVRWIIGLTLVAALLAWLLHGGESGGSQQATFVPTTYSSAGYGLRALYLTLDELGYQPVRLRRPLNDELPARGSLFVVQPVAPVAEVEWRALEAWVQRGHTLILAADSGLPGLLAASPMFGSLLDIPVSYAHPAQPVHLARGVTRLAVKSDAHIEVTAGQDKGTHRVPTPDQTPVTGSGPRRLLGEGVPVFRDEGRAIVTYAKVGKGEVIFLASPWSLTNEGIGKADNIVFALNAVGEAGRGPVFFDEYHHGYGESALSRITPWPMKLAAAQILLGILVAMFARSRRFGRIRPLLRESRERSDFLATMAAVLRRGEATRLAVRTARDALAHRLSRLLGLPPGAGSEALARAASRVNAEAGAKLGRALPQCDAALQSTEELSQPRALALIRELDEAERALRRV
jgi:hypothetical protein